jgi:glycosyltransferase involved in cell wall biosynthesis
MRIARIRHLFYPDMPSDYFYELSAQQVKRGHDVDVVSWCRNGICSEEKVAEGFTIHRLNGLNLNLGSLIREYPYLLGLSSKLETLRPDVIHGESHLFLSTVQAVRKAKKLGLPCVVTVHGVFADRGSVVNVAQKAYLHTLGLEVFRNADRVICLTRKDAEDIGRLGCSLEKIRLVPNAVDTDMFKPCNEREPNLVVWVGRFVHEKGVRYLIEAARIVVDTFKDVRFLLIGYGPLKADIIRLIHERNLEKFVNVVGPLSRNEIAKVLGRATIFVFPSLKEGLPVSVLESMASGVPVVGSRISGVSDIVEDGVSGLLVPQKEHKFIAAAIMKLVEDSDMQRRFGRNARKFVERNCSWTRVLTQLDNVYRDAIYSNTSRFFS